MSISLIFCQSPLDLEIGIGDWKLELDIYFKAQNSRIMITDEKHEDLFCGNPADDCVVWAAKLFLMITAL